RPARHRGAGAAPQRAAGGDRRDEERDAGAGGVADEALLVGAEPADAGDRARPRRHVRRAGGERPLAVRLPALAREHHRGGQLRGAPQHHRGARAGTAPEPLALFVDGRFAVYLVVAAVLIITPGPDTALVIR